MSAPQPLSVAQTAIDPNLVERCRELLEWSKTGLLAGGKGGAVRALATDLEAIIGPNYALTVAEGQTKDDAMREIVRLAAQRQPDSGASPFLWICIVPGKWQPEHIRAWTRDPDQAAAFADQGMEMIPLFKGPALPSTASRTAED